MTKKKDIFYGRNPVLEGLYSGKSVDKIFIEKKSSGKEIEEIKKLCKQQNIPYKIVPSEKIQRILQPYSTIKTPAHQGVVGIWAAISYSTIDHILNAALDKGEDLKLLILDGITDVRNFGAIVRTAEGFGMHGILIEHKKSSQINAESMKASAGALNYMPICRTNNIASAIHYLQLNGISILGASLHAKKSLQEVDFDKPVAIVLGSEGSGMRHDVENACNELFYIPMKGKIESFNVSVSCGIILSKMNGLV